MSKKHHGFTIVELLVVIVVIGVLATIVVLAFSAVRQGAIATSLTSDLDGASKTIKLDQVTKGTYPVANDCSASPVTGSVCLKSLNGTSYQFTSNNSVNPQTFCITATNGTTSYYINQDSTPSVGACAGHIAGGSDPSQLAWTQRIPTGAPIDGWNSIATSSDGTKLVASNGDKVYTSTDSGATWTPRLTAPNYKWSTVASSSDGTKLYAGEATDETYGGGTFWTSSNSGVSWTIRPAAPLDAWLTVKASSDGTKLIASLSGVFGSDGIYTSTDSGVNWTERTFLGRKNWAGIASSSDGVKLTVAVNDYTDSSIYTSTNSGATWVQRSTAGSRQWGGIASSDDGVKLAAYVNSGGYIYTSTDSGATWTQQSGSLTSLGSYGYRQAIASSSDGTKLFVASSDRLLYISTDSGVTWTGQVGTGNRSWFSVAMTPSGSKYFAGVAYQNMLYTGQ